MFFNRKEKKPRLYISTFDAENRLIAKTEVRDFELPECAVLTLSVEFFNDPEPCEIHRGAVQKRATLELTEQLADAGRVPLETLPWRLRSFFPDTVAFVCVTEEP